MTLMGKFKLFFMIYIIGILSMGIAFGILFTRGEFSSHFYIIITISLVLVTIAMTYGERSGVFTTWKDVVRNYDEKKN